MRKIIIYIFILVSLFILISCQNQNASTTITVRYYFENLENEEYTLKETVNIDSFVGKTISFTPEENEGFSLNENISILTGKATEDESFMLHLYYDRLLYTIEFYDNDMLDKKIEAKYGALLVVEDLQKDGYSFEGWSIEGALTELNSPVNSDLKLTAVWKEFDAINITLYDELTILSTFTIGYATKLELDDLVKEGYRFLGWKERGEEEFFDLSSPITHDLELEAIFKEINSSYTGYYEGADNLEEAELVLFLHELLNRTYHGITYGNVRYRLADTDKDPNNSQNVILIYLATSVSNVWDSGATWNREHVWPQSLLGAKATNSVTNIASDLHNLKPADPAENARRSNKFFGTSSGTYEPRDEVKGDVARILFYMDVMYEQLSLIHANSGGALQMGNLEKLLEWHDLDPVDDFEMNRNNKIEDFQGNRNPFIDHPEFVGKIYQTNNVEIDLYIPEGIFSYMVLEQSSI